LEIFSKAFSAINSAMLNSKILIVLGATIWMIFQNSVTYDVSHLYGWLLIDARDQTIHGIFQVLH